MTSISLPGHRGLKAIKLTSITYLKGCGNYTVFHLTSGKELMVSQTLKVYADLPGFVRISKSIMINKQFVERIKRVDSKNAFVVSRTGLVLPISRRRIGVILDEFRQTGGPE